MKNITLKIETSNLVDQWFVINYIKENVYAKIEVENIMHGERINITKEEYYNFKNKIRELIKDNHILIALTADIYESKIIIQERNIYDGVHDRDYTSSKFRQIGEEIE